MKLLIGLVILKGALCLTNEEVAAFTCRSGTYAQFMKSNAGGGSSVSDVADSSNGFMGCLPDQGTPCFKTEHTCSVSLSVDGSRWHFQSNGIPDHIAWGLTGQDGTISSNSNEFYIPQTPVLLDIGLATNANQGSIGFAVNGVSIFGPYNSGCCDATFVELETMDACIGHPANGNYHYHYFAKNTLGYDGCLMGCQAGVVSDIVGFAKDGFAIYGPMQHYSPSEGKIYIDPANCSDCVLRQLMTAQLDICGGIEVADGVVSVGSVYRYIVTGLFPYNFQCYRGDISLSQNANGNTFTSNNACALNGADCSTGGSLFDQSYVDGLDGCSPGNCPYTVSDLRTTDHELSEVYYQCTGCTNDACIDDDDYEPPTDEPPTEEPPVECKCETDTVLDLISNTNNGNQFPVLGSCDEQGSKTEDWTAYCDANSNGVKDDGETEITFTMNKKCKKISSGTSEIDCGDGEVVLDCDCDSKPKDCAECDAECVSVAKKTVEIKFSCPEGTENAGASATLSGKCKKISKQEVSLSCDGGSTSLDCKCDTQISDIVSDAGGSAAAVCLVDSKKPTWKIFCDDNGDGEHDNSENSDTISGKCKKLKSSITC